MLAINTGIQGMSSGLPTVRVLGFSDALGFTQYAIQTQHGGGGRTVTSAHNYRRYSEFLALHRAIGGRFART